MDVEDEANSYLTYLNDSETPNTFLLGNNEIGLFSVEPIFTEMDASGWSEEGFPLLLTNSLIPENSSDKPPEDTEVGQPEVEVSKIELLKSGTNECTNIQTIFESHTLQEFDLKNVNEITNKIEKQLDKTPSKKGKDRTEPQCENNMHLELNETLGETFVLLNRPENGLIEVSQNALICNENNAEFDMELTTKFGDNVNNEYTVIQLNPEENYEKVGNSSIERTVIHLEDNVSFIILNPEDIEETYCQFDKNESLLSNSHSQEEPKQDLCLSKFQEVKILSETNNDADSLTVNKSKLRPISILNKINQKDNTQAVGLNNLFSTVVANKCKICSYLCENLDQIKQHIKEKHIKSISNQLLKTTPVASIKVNDRDESGNKEYTVFICSVCRGICLNKNDLRKHMIQNHQLGTPAEKSTSTQTETGDCQNKPVNKSAVLNDLLVSMVKKQETEMQKVRCTIKGCIAAFPSEDLKERHKALHQNDNKNVFKCEECNKTFMLWRIARNHMFREHKIDFGTLFCPVCKSFRSYKTVAILRHMMLHSDEKNYVCSECGKAFKQMSQLKNHEMLHKPPEDLPVWMRIKKCNKCDRFFANSKSLKVHIQAVHEDFRPFICNVCGHKCSRKAMLELHIRQHTGEKPYTCNHCNYKTRDPNCLRRHIKRHLGAATYQCPYCPYKCIQVYSIKNHLMKKHKENDLGLSCKYCSYTTINQSSLQAHQMKHEIAQDPKTDTTKIDTRGEGKNETELQVDEETQSCFLNTESQMEETVDKGGITIPAGLEMQLVS